MRLCSVKYEGKWHVGVLDAAFQKIAVYPAKIGLVDDVISSGGLEQKVQHIAEIELEDAIIGAPIQRPRKNVFCVGWNYWDHFEESKGKREGQDPDERPSHPTFFTKAPRTIIGPLDDIECDFTMSNQWDYEAEIALIIGKPGKDITEEAAFDHVFGMTLANDISVRDVQRAHGGQWFKGKSIDRTMPLGPWITTLDDIDDLPNVRIECLLNDSGMQDAFVKQMAFSIPTIIAELSRGMTLDKGDIVLTGTPSGIGNAREPQVFLKRGDVVTTRASGLGYMKNRVC